MSSPEGVLEELVAGGTFRKVVWGEGGRVVEERVWVQCQVRVSVEAPVWVMPLEPDNRQEPMFGVVGQLFDGSPGLLPWNGVLCGLSCVRVGWSAGIQPSLRQHSRARRGLTLLGVRASCR